MLWDERLYDLHLTGVETEEQLRQLVRINIDQGVSPFDAIRGATSFTAEMLGVEDETGSIQPGLDADLSVVDLNPLDDIRSPQDVLVVVSNGYLVLKRIPFEK